MGSQRPRGRLEVRLTEDNQVHRAAPQKPFADKIHQRLPHRCAQNENPDALGDPIENRTELVALITNENRGPCPNGVALRSSCALPIGRVDI
jgi:hypothetical protein